MNRRRFVVVSGAPGSGKSTLAEPLAAALGLPLVAKDYIKEAIWDAIGPRPGDLGWSRRTGAAAMEVLWAVAEHSERFVLEANFRPHSDYERSRLAGLAGRFVEVHCDCPPALAVQRYAARAAGTGHHNAHVGRSVTLSDLSEFDRPLAMGPVISVDTAAEVDIQSVARQVLAAQD